MNCEDCRLGKPLYYRDGRFGHEWHGNNLVKCRKVEQYIKADVDLSAIIQAVEKYDPEGDILTAISNMHDTIALLDQKLKQSEQFWKSNHDTILSVSGSSAMTDLNKAIEELQKIQDSNERERQREERMAELTEEVRKFDQLLQDQHPGLWTWQMWFSERAEHLMKLLREMGFK